MHHMRSYVQAFFGKDAWPTVLSAMSDEDASAVRHVLPVGWYPLELQYRLIHTIDATCGKGDGGLVEPIGRHEAQQDLTVVHRLFLRMANPGFVLEQAGRYWGRFYTSGAWTVQRRSSTSASACLTGLDPFDPCMCDYLEAYLEEMWRLMGVEVSNSRAWIDRQDIHFEGAWR